LLQLRAVNKLAGVLGLQGDYAKHARALSRLGLEVVLVRHPEQLAGLSLLALPGGESTTMSLLLDSSGLRQPLRQAILPRRLGGAGLPTLATCAGVILLARDLLHDDGSIRVHTLNVLDATVDRNAYGRQVHSFEARVEVDWDALGFNGSREALHGVFIRAPRISNCGPDVRSVADYDGAQVVVRQDNILAATFHPELTDDTRLHQAALGLG
jgi:pyridoxal 5'-phosphate synthase pdxT subunit